MNNTPNKRLDTIAGLGTWVVVFSISLYWLYHAPVKYSENILLVSLFFVVYIISFVFVTKDTTIQNNRRQILGIYSLQLLSTFFIVWYLPLDYLAILTIIWVSMLPKFVSIKRSIVITFLVVIAWFSLYGLHWQENVLFQGALFGTFHFFAILMTANTQAAELATAKSERLNTELLATQQLLSEVSRQNERTRIARDLHDLLGHHLTALIINLQVAGHITDGEAKSKVEQCHSIAKLLLSDVREAVTALNENQSLDFHKLVNLMIENIPRLNITNNIDAQINLENINIAKTLLSSIQEAITNSLRHSAATEFNIIMNEENDCIILELFDNGRLNGPIIKGNGLTGMTQRVDELGGQLIIDSKVSALRIKITIPLNDESMKSGQEIT